MPEQDLRLAEVMGAFTLACDLAFGFPLEKGVRTSLLATNLARAHGLSAQELADVYYTALLRFMGCTAFAHEETHLFGAGDDHSVRQAMFTADLANPLPTLGRIVSTVARGAGPWNRALSVARLLNPKVMARHAASQCDATLGFARLAGMSEGVIGALSHICERWDGRGLPGGIAGEALSLPMRFVHLASIAEIYHREGGREAALAEVRRRRGKHFDPALADTFLKQGDALLAELETTSVWEPFLAAEPASRVRLHRKRLEETALAFGRMVDLKSVFTLGHSEGVAELAVKAAERLGWDEPAKSRLRIAGLLHDAGVVSVPTGIWEKPGALGPAEWERVRLHAYYTERILSQSEALRPLASLAGAHHERMEGSGYPKGTPSALQTPEARLLASCDAFQAMGQARAYRPARGPAEAAGLLQAEAKAGRLDAASVSAVLEAAGQVTRALRGAWPAGLTDREVDVIRLIAAGKSNKEIGVALGISPRTAQHHTIHVYGKIGGSSRAAAALFAMENGLLKK